MSFLSDAIDHASKLHADVLSCRLAAYRELLAVHDWLFEFSDDQRVWQRGRDQRADLEAMRREVDVEGSVWNECAPQAFRRGGAL